MAEDSSSAFSPIKIKKAKRVEEKEENCYLYVPEEIVVLILPRLPVKSLLRFKSVSKSWHSSISDPKFNISTTRQQVIVMSSRGPTQFGGQLRFSMHAIDDEASVMELPIPNQLIDNLSNAGPIFWGSCNGLLLVSFGVDFFLWNPLTGYCNKGLSHRWLNLSFNCGNADVLISGLCYDSLSDDYKIIMAFTFGGSFMVGSFRSKTWIESIPFPYPKCYLKSGPTINDRAHWLVLSEEGQGSQIKPYLIVSFDPRTNEFVNVPMPQHERFEGSIIRGVGVLDGCLSLALSTNHHEERELCDVEVLAMKKYGDKASWISLFVMSKLTVFDPIHSLAVILGSTINGEVLMQFYSSLQWQARLQWKANGGILTYDTKCNTYREFPIPNHRADTVFSTTVVESLVSPQTVIGR